MFAVKGWNISAPLKTQTVSSSKKDKSSGSTNAKSSKKRKRSGDGNERRDKSEVTGSNGTTLASSREALFSERASQADESKVDNLNPQNHVAVQSRETASQDVSSMVDDESSKTERKKRKKKTKIASDREYGAETPSAIVSKTSTSNKSSEPTTQSIPPLPIQVDAGLTPLQSAMRQKLVSSRFRYLNETLYTTTSTQSLELFRDNPNFFDEYHEGFARQVDAWPENPVNGFAALIVARGRISSKGYTPAKFKGLSEEAASLRARSELLAKKRAGVNMGASEPLPRDLKNKQTVIVDLGCGTGALARQLQPFNGALGLSIHSFDLSSPNEFVKVADIRSLPLPDNSVDVAVFSLALMGTNWVEFVEEAWRVLKWKGECWVADVKSRFTGSIRKGKVVKHSVGARVKTPKTTKLPPGEDPELDQIPDEDFLEEEPAEQKDGTDVTPFVTVLQRRGFELVKEADLSNKMFARMRFIKAAAPSRGKGSDNRGQKRFKTAKYFIDKAPAADEISVEEEARVLKPCVYKTR